MLITDIIEYFRSLANRHKDVACFRTGESYEFNESGLSYPLAFLHTDFVTSYSGQGGLLDAEYVFLTFRFSVLALSREQYDAKPDNQIKMSNVFTKQDEDIALTHQILGQFVAKITSDLNDDFLFGWMMTDDNGGTALKRITNNDCEGWYVDLKFKVHNDILCNYEDAFGDDVIDSGTNKTQFQSPINSNPL